MHGRVDGSGYLVQVAARQQPLAIDVDRVLLSVRAAPADAARSGESRSVDVGDAGSLPVKHELHRRVQRICVHESHSDLWLRR